jgi:replicative DNA helicase
MNLILHKILASQDLEAWARLKKEFFEAPYTEIYILINKFYQKFDKLPSFEELEAVTRDEKQANYITALKQLTVPDDLNIEVILQAVINEYAQREVLQQLGGYLDTLVFKDVGEIVEDLSVISIDIEEKTEVSEHVVEMNHYFTIDSDTIASRTPLGLNNDFDRRSLGMTPGEYVMLGGYRGSGKSAVCSNIVCAQYLQGNSSLYFSIEMDSREIFDRHISILSGVPIKHIKSGNLSEIEKISIANVRAAMTSDGSQDLLDEYRQTKDFNKFERKLIDRTLIPDNRIITIDNPGLTIANIDATLHTYKTRLEDKLKIVVVDYINQITAPDAFNWQSQINLSKKLKALARKYDVVMVTPFQISEDGKTRFAKGILDSPDWAFNLTAEKDGEGGGAVTFECKKARGDDDSVDFASEMDWTTLKISAHKNFMTKSTETVKEAPKSVGDLKV